MIETKTSVKYGLFRNQVDIIHQLIFVRFSDGNDFRPGLAADNNRVILNWFHLAHIDYKRSVNPHKLIGRHLFSDGFHGEMNGKLIFKRVDHHIILQCFNPKNIFKIDQDQRDVVFDEYDGTLILKALYIIKA